MFIVRRHVAVLFFFFCFHVISPPHLFAQNEVPVLVMKNRSGEAVAQAIVSVDSCTCDSVLLASGYNINTKTGKFRTLEFPFELSGTLKKIPCVEYAEIAGPGNSARLKNDAERQFSSVDKVHNGTSNSLPMNYKGKGVVIGIVDIGFQCNNPTFFDANGTATRISRYWHQGNNAGSPPAGYTYGTEWTDSGQILAANDMDGTHGTHVAGIAGGSGYSSPGNQYAGMAPEAELVFVSIRYANDTLGGSALGDYLVANPAILDAYSYIFDYAQSVGKPAVINLSWGMHTGPHDGTSLFDLTTKSLTGPGKILVGANGNEGDNPMHLRHEFSGDTIGTIMIENGRQFRQRESVYADMWGSAGSSFSAKIRFIDTNKNIIAETPFVSSLTDSVSSFVFFADSSEFKASFTCEDSFYTNGKLNITVTAAHLNQRKYAIVLFITSGQAEVHAWNSGAAREWTSGSFRNKLNQIDFSSEYKAGDSEYTAGENGGTSPSVISVGALAARSSYMNVKGVFVNDSWYVVPGQLARFSSRGPTVDGRIKPDICAPGYDVPSAVNNRQFASWMLDKTVLKSVFRQDTQYWSAFNGTSMAAPHVSGIVALLLQIKPDLTPAEVQYILSSTATADSWTRQVPNMSYGYGKVNAYAAVVKTLQISDVAHLTDGKQRLFYPNPVSEIINFELPSSFKGGTAEILGFDGKVIQQWGLEPGSRIQTFRLNPLIPPGNYLIRLFDGEHIFLGKMIRQ